MSDIQVSSFLGAYWILMFFRACMVTMPQCSQDLEGSTSKNAKSWTILFKTPKGFLSQLVYYCSNIFGSLIIEFVYIWVAFNATTFSIKMWTNHFWACSKAMAFFTLLCIILSTKMMQTCCRKGFFKNWLIFQDFPKSNSLMPLKGRIHFEKSWKRLVNTCFMDYGTRA